MLILFYIHNVKRVQAEQIFVLKDMVFNLPRMPFYVKNLKRLNA